MTAEVFTRDGVEIRRFDSGRCVLEDEWEQFIEINEPLYISYMLRNEPFEELPVPYKPVTHLGHHPPRLSFGFAIPKEFIQFRRVALENNLGDPEEVSTTNSFFGLQRLVMPYLNERCGLPPKQGITCGHVHSKQAALVLELTTNYVWRIPKEKLDDAIRGIKEVFQLPDDAKPKWYLEGDIDLKEPDEYLLPMSFFNWSKCY